MRSAESIAKALGGNVRGDTVHAPGPGHSPQDRSLSIKVDSKAPEGFVVHSFAGDDPIDCRDYVRQRTGLPAWEPTKSSADPIGNMMARQKARVVAEYIYRAPDGQPSRKVTRTEPKGFPQYRWTGSGWEAGVKGVPLYPYRLPEMLGAVHDGVYICEGEKDTDRLASLGYIATTNPMGAGKWHPDLSKWFEGKVCYIMEDNDDAGRNHARKVANELHPIADSVRVITFHDLPEKGDVSDWLDAATGRVNELVDYARGFPLWTPEAEAEMVPQSAASSTITADDLQAMTFPPVSYVIPGYVVEGLSLLAGKPKIGKSWLVLDMAVAVARGGFVLGDIKCPEGDVLYAALEDNPRRLQNRMKKVLQSQPWPKRLEFATDMPRLNEGGVESLTDWIKSHEKPRLIIVDTLAKVRAVKKGNEDPYASDYAAVTGLKVIADEYGVAIVLVHHVRKMEADDPLDTKRHHRPYRSRGQHPCPKPYKPRRDALRARPRYRGNREGGGIQPRNLPLDRQGRCSGRSTLRRSQ